MRICIDGLGINRLNGTGLYSYSYSLIKDLTYFHPQSEYHILWDNSPSPKLSGISSVTFDEVKVNRIAGDFSNLLDYLKNNKILIYHSPNNGFSVPPSKACAYIITVHDLLALNNNKHVDKKYRDKFITNFPSAVKNADKIIAVSNFIKEQLLTYFPIPEDRIEVIYPTCSIDTPELENSDAKNILKSKYNIDGKFLLYSGSIHPRKNLRSLIAIFNDVLKENPNLKLVIIGKTDGKRLPYYKELIAITKHLGINDSVIFSGIVPLCDMHYFYLQCECFINVSDYEGFPLTVLEAMMCKAPVICSNIPSMVEVASDYGIMVNQKDPTEIKNAILRIINNKLYTEYLKIKSIDQLKKFNTISQVNKLVRLYETFM